MGIATRLGTENVLSFNMLEITDYGRPMKPFFIELLGLKECLVECATLCVKSEVILMYVTTDDVYETYTPK